MVRLLFTLLLSIFIFHACERKQQFSISFEGEKAFNLDDMINTVKKQDKKLLVYFSSLACVNCRKIEQEINNDTELKKIIAENYLFIALITDDKQLAKKEYWKKNKFNNRLKKSVGEINSEWQTELTKTGSQPTFTVIDKNKNAQLTLSYIEDMNKFANLLKEYATQ